MTKAYLIIFDADSLGVKSDLFLEAIRSSFVSKMYNKNSIFILGGADSTPSSTYRQIESHLKYSASFLVVKLDYFFGNFPEEVSKWYENNFNVKLKSDEKEIEK